MIIQIVGGVLLGILIIIFSVDLIFIGKDWLSRIYIGRFSDKQHWNRSITGVGLDWLSNTPKIKVTDNTRLVAIDMIKGNYSSSAIQHWQEASLLLGLSEYIKVQDDGKANGRIESYLSKKFDREGQWLHKPVHVDGAILAYAIMNLGDSYTHTYKKALDTMWELIQQHIGSDGTVAYRKTMQNYRYVDTIGFICPFLVAYGIKYNKSECVDLAVKQIRAYEEYGMLHELFIPCHAYRLDSKTPLGLYGWGRGMGWFAIGLIDAWKELPEHHTYKSVLSETIKRFAKAIIPLQQPDGNWNWTATREESRPDSSATATLGWFLLHASKIEGISEECQHSFDKAISYLMKVTRRNGVIDFSQGDTKDIGVYSMLFDLLPFTQGFGIRMINYDQVADKT
ncbi:glycoside hydrolase family 88 protein [Paenibacillus sp. 1_12]|uniref:glycoside hydrolase family 88 protein n=1 Tax=Paenibacillus sp. 1_12 TaxID=1566278 RepID=UPI000B89A0D6|nr:glycoside hydrolase family 88 protein [Paenibacillus sp. 1_12]